MNFRVSPVIRYNNAAYESDTSPTTQDTDTLKDGTGKKATSSYVQQGQDRAKLARKTGVSDCIVEPGYSTMAEVQVYQQLSSR